MLGNDLCGQTIGEKGNKKMLKRDFEALSVEEKTLFVLRQIEKNTDSIKGWLTFFGLLVILGGTLFLLSTCMGLAAH